MQMCRLRLTRLITLSRLGIHPLIAVSRFDLNTLNSIVVLKPFEEHVSCETQTVDSSVSFGPTSIDSSVVSLRSEYIEIHFEVTTHSWKCIVSDSIG